MDEGRESVPHLVDYSPEEGPVSHIDTTNVTEKQAASTCMAAEASVDTNRDLEFRRPRSPRHSIVLLQFFKGLVY